MKVLVQNTITKINQRLSTKQKPLNFFSPRVFWTIILIGMLLKYSYYGLRYFPIMDDNNMYGVFSLFRPWDALIRYQWYKSRIFASLFDIYVVARFWGSLWIILFGTTLLHFFSMYMLDTLLKRMKIPAGTLLVLIYGFCPLGFEASYWIAASSRVIVGMFFATGSSFLLMKWLENQDHTRKAFWSLLAAFCAVNLLSLGFYEQVIVMSFILTAFVFIMQYKAIKYKWVVALPFLNLIIMAAFSKLVSGGGANAARMKLVSAHYLTHTRLVLTQIKELLVKLPYRMIKNGIINAIQMINTEGFSLFILLAALFSIALGVYYSRESIHFPLRPGIIRAVVAVGIIIASFAPFFVLDTIWICPRNAFPAFIGVGILAEALISIVFYHSIFRNQFLNIIKGTILAIMCFVFLLVNWVELRDTQNVSLMDQKIIQNFTQTVMSVKNGDTTSYKALFLNVKDRYVKLNSDRISNCTGSDWGFMGALQAINRNKVMGGVVPIASNQTIQYKKSDLKGTLLIGIDAYAQTFSLEGTWTSDSKMTVKTSQNQIFGTLEVLPGNQLLFKAIVQ